MPLPHFEPNPAHRYTFGGRELPSVTTVLSDEGLLPSYWWLDDWYRDRGSAAHTAAALLLQGRLDRQSLDPAIAPMIDNLERFVDRWGCEALLVEQPLADPVLGYAGTPDAVLKSDQLGIFVPDLKATTTEPGHRLQLIAYLDLLLLAAEADEIPVGRGELEGSRLCVLPLRAKLPTPVWLTDSITERHTLRGVFRAALTTWSWKRGQRGEIR